MRVNPTVNPSNQIIQELPPEDGFTAAEFWARLKRVAKGGALGAVVAWMFGACCFVELAMIFKVNGNFLIGVLSYGLYWAVVAGFVGLNIGWWGGWTEIVGVMAATAILTQVELLTPNPDGWLILTVMLGSWGCAILTLGALGLIRFIIYVVRVELKTAGW